MTTVVVERRDRFARFGAEHVEATLAARGRWLPVADPSEGSPSEQAPTTWSGT